MPPKSKRLVKDSVEAVFKTGKTINSDNIFAKYIKNSLNIGRFSVIAGKKQFKTAVERNYQKRLVNNYIKGKSIASGFDVVFSVKNDVKKLKKEDLEKELSFIIEKIR